MKAAIWQHAVAIAAAAGALAWLVRRAVKGGGSKATGPCASCPASRGASGRVAIQTISTRRSNVHAKTQNAEHQPASRP
jgi:hypothetical protein